MFLMPVQMNYIRYPEKTREDIEVACPFCQGNCNCRYCLKENLVVMVCVLC